MLVLLIEPYYSGSHRSWVEGYVQHSRHQVATLTLPGQFWKWRMQGGAVTLARMFRERQLRPDVILASDMFDLSTFRALTRDQTSAIPIALYFHENQLTYPQNARQRHGWQYGFINYISALAADAVVFNSRYHRDAFYQALPHMLKHFGDFNELDTIDELRGRTVVLAPGLDFERFERVMPSSATSGPPVILWNHRWEEDKNPHAFFKVLYHLQAMGIGFRLAIAGENFRRVPVEFEEAKQRLGDRIVHFGYAPSFEAYARLLWQSDYVVSTARHEFFGMATAEAIYCECVPLLPFRLNYPDLVPATLHEICLYRHGELTDKLRRHLTMESNADKAALRSHIAQYDWTVVAPQYDALLEQLARSITGF